MKSFLVAAIRLGGAIFLALFALTLVIAAGTWGYYRYQELEAKPYEEVKVWKSDLKANLGLTLEARTKLIEGSMLTSVAVDGFPEYLSDPRLKTRNENASFTLHFTDADGFTVFSKPIKLTEFSARVNDKDEKIGMRAQAQYYVPLSDYKRFKSFQVEWNIETKAPSVTLVPVPDTKPAAVRLDPCAPNIARAERLRRLATHGTVRQSSENSFTAGGKSLTFFSDGELLDCY